MKTICSQLVFCFLMLSGLTTTVFADPPRVNHYHWRNKNYPSHYILYDAATRTYVETVDCKIFYRFNLVTDELNTLTLIDRSRNMTIRMNYDGMWLKAAGAADFTFYQAGTFDTRTSFHNLNPNGSVASVISKQHACAWQEIFTGQSAPAFRFVQKAVNNDMVELFDASRNMWVRLDANAIYLKSGTAAYSFFHSGAWR